MSDIQAAAQARVIQIGPDRVTIKDNEVIIEAKNRMPDWQVRELNPPPVYFEDKKYHLVEAYKAQSPYAVRYLLVPWPEDMSTNSKLFCSYDAEAVAERDGALKTGRMEGLTRALLMPFYPALGLLWSGVQKRLMRFGFAPHGITGISIFFVFCLLFGQGVFAVVTINASLRSGKMVVGGLLSALCHHGSLHLGPVHIPLALLDTLMTVAFLADVAMRYSLYLKDHDWSGGFLEWLFRRETKKSEFSA